VLRLLGIALVLTVAACVLAASHVYLIQRLVLDAGLAAPWRALLTLAIALLGATLVLQPIAERRLGRALWLAWPASLWMGFGFLLLLGLAATDALLWATGSPALAVSAAPGPGPADGVAALRAAGVLAVALVAGGFGLRGGLRPPQLRRVSFAIDRWPAAFEGFRIVQISDIHIGPILDRRFAAELTRRVNALAPDLIAVTGDLVDGSARHLADEVAPFASLRATHGVYFVTGNHDHLSGAPSWVDEVERLGMQPLRNRRVRVGDGDACFDLVGVDDHHARFIGGGGEDLDAALAGRDARRPAVLLAHDPSTFRRARRRDIDLQLSGHTHGGQIWPFGFLVRLVIPWVAGCYRDGRAQLYVSRGTGFWGPPMRLRAPAEITEITLRAA
jgi:predicted MPP superfamily phosphohydrolase